MNSWLSGLNSFLGTATATFKDVWSTVNPPKTAKPVQAPPSPAAQQGMGLSQTLLWVAVALLGFAFVWPMIRK